MYLTVQTSEAYLDELKDNTEVEILNEPYEIEFTDDGFVIDYD